MDCPACGNGLKEATVGDVTVDICQGGCGGIWFDNQELKKVDEQHESAGEALLDVERNPDVNVDLQAKRPCPKCDSVIMMKHFVSTKREVEVDECAACGGIWLDAGELRAIREQFATDEERTKAAREYFSDVFKDEIKAERKKSENELAGMRRVASALRFICPSYYIPGKQDGAAF